MILGLLLTGCRQQATLPPPAPLVTQPWPDVRIEWHAQISQDALDRYARPEGAPRHVLGTAWMRPDGTCEVHLMLDAVRTPEVSAHEAAHCLAITRHGDWSEATAEAYVPRYLQACGVTVAPLGLPDPRPSTCAVPPDL